jgi:hypothetical protein
MKLKSIFYSALAPTMPISFCDDVCSSSSTLVRPLRVFVFPPENRKQVNANLILAELSVQSRELAGSESCERRFYTVKLYYERRSDRYG